MRSDGQGAASRSIGEYIVLTSLAASLLFWGYLIAFGTLTFDGSPALARLQILIFLSLGAVALVLLWRRKILGAWLSLVFYGIQVIRVVLPSGSKIEFNSLPFVSFRVYGLEDEGASVSLNLVALLLFVFSWILLVMYRKSR